MTGYGRAEGPVAGRAYLVEVRCLNHRYTDVRLSLPRQWLELEVEIDRRVRERIGRGRVECSVRACGGGGEQGVPVLDAVRARQFLEAYTKLAELLGTKQPPVFKLVARADGVVSYQPEAVDLTLVRSDLGRLVDEALAAADGMRLTEGAALRQVIDGHLNAIGDLVDHIQAAIPAEQQALHERTTERVRALAADAEVKQERLEQELAILAERADVTEELARLLSHLEQFGDLMERDGPIGRELDFLLQEMNREVNTLCSKFHSAPVVRQAVAGKAELEKLREQIQNIE